MKFITLILGILLITASACTNKNMQKESGMDIYLLIGQSNMAGRAEINQEYMDTLEGVFLLSNDTVNPWEGAANPLNKYSSIRKNINMQRLGPGYSFAKQMKKQTPGREIGLVVNAKGGTSILQWGPSTLFYKEAVNRTKIAMDYGSLRGILWLQGESDVSRTEVYLDSLIQMVNSFRVDFNQPDLPFVACELSVAKPGRIPFNEMLRTLPEKLENSAVIPSDGTATIDSTHFDSASQILLGERFADQLSELLNN